MSNHRYQLEPYTGKQSRFECPKCEKPLQFTRYVDTHTGEHLPYEYGICNRKNKCDYAKNPYTEGYAQEQKQHEKEQAEPRKRIPLPKPEIKQIFIPSSIQSQSLGNYSNNQFVQYLIRLLGHQIAFNLVRRFQIGTSNYWDGASVFWLLDEAARVYGGQVILYDENGNTKKEIQANGVKRRYNSWVHVALRKKYEQTGQANPKWLREYSAHSPKFPIPFGLHQLKTASPEKKIALVESAKTAIIASAYLPQFIWMAVGGLSYLNASRLQPLSHRKLILFPDKGAYATWHKKALALSHIAPIAVSDLLESQEVELGNDLADFLVPYSLREVSSR